MRPKVFVYAALLDPEKMASFTDAVNSFDFEEFHEVIDTFKRASCTDSGTHVDDLSTVGWRMIFDTSIERRRLVVDTRPVGWRSTRVGEYTLYHPHRGSSLWEEISRREYYEILDAVPCPFTLLLDRPTLVNDSLAANSRDTLITIQPDPYAGVVNLVSLVELSGFHSPHQLVPPSTTRN